MIDILRIAGASVELHPNGMTVTTYQTGERVPAVPQHDETYRARAVSLGYGDDVAAMSRDHEIGHHLLAHWLGLLHSPTLRGVSLRDHWVHWQAEEAAVLAVQSMRGSLGWTW